MSTTAPLEEFSSMTTALFAVHQTLDAIGVERGPLEIRLAYLRGVGLGLQRWALPSTQITVEPPAAQPAPAATPVVQPAAEPAPPAEPAPAAAPAKPGPMQTQGEAQEAADLDEIRRIATAAGGEVESVRALGSETDPLDWESTEDLPAEHEGWTDSERRAFFASLKDSKISDPYAVVAAYCESKMQPRPSRMTATQRNGFLAALAGQGEGNAEKRKRYMEWAALHGAGAIAEAKAAAKAAKAAAKAAQ